MRSQKREKTEDTKVSVCSKMGLEIKEVRSSSCTHSQKEGYSEVSSNTETKFHWKLKGIASKIGADVVNSDNFDPTGQEVYEVEFRSQGFELGYFSGFKTREKAIQNALEFAKRNGIDVDGYAA